jgi:hypothetical protein
LAEQLAIANSSIPRIHPTASCWALNLFWINASPLSWHVSEYTYDFPLAGRYIAARPPRNIPHQCAVDMASSAVLPHKSK